MAVSKLFRVNSRSYINFQTVPEITWETASLVEQLCTGPSEQFNSAGTSACALVLFIYQLRQSLELT